MGLTSATSRGQPIPLSKKYLESCPLVLGTGEYRQPGEPFLLWDCFQSREPCGGASSLFMITDTFPLEPRGMYFPTPMMMALSWDMLWPVGHRGVPVCWF